MIVMKFGGSSLATVERIRGVSAIIAKHLNKQPIIVLSALGDTTDYLNTIAAQAIAKKHDLTFIQGYYKNICSDLGIDFVVRDILVELSVFLSKLSAYDHISAEHRDYLLSFGERMTVRVFSEHLNTINMKSKYFDAWDIGFKTDSIFGSAKVLMNTYPAIQKYFSELKNNYSYTPVVTGFIAQSENRKITTLGRGGSDLTATVIGCALNVDEIQFWKDVNGILSANPNYIQNAQSIEMISFEEASEMATLGASVIQSGSMKPAMDQNIPIRVKNSYEPDAMGTLIQKELNENSYKIKTINLVRSHEKKAVLSVVGKLFSRNDTLKNIKDLFEANHIPAEEIKLGNANFNVSFTMDDKYSEKAYQVFHKHFFEQ